MHTNDIFPISDFKAELRPFSLKRHMTEKQACELCPVQSYESGDARGTRGQPRGVYESCLKAYAFMAISWEPRASSLESPGHLLGAQ